ncbi:MAG: hypothetical protein RLZZ440_2780 [Planctomycetota bacterium]|jgi:hypothetical protein
MTAVATGLVLLVAAGCGGSGPRLARVEGVVTLDGKPLSTGRVTFWPAAGRSGSGWIEADGSFRLGTFGDADGAVVGPHKVAVTPASQTPTGPPDFDRDGPVKGWPRSPIPARYSNPESSGLAFEVQPGRNRFEIDLTTK